jgi:uncharacterized membrane protein
MTETSSPLLAIELSPHRSLSRGGFIALMSVLIGFNLVAGIVFWSVGAWPVLGFMGVDVLLVWLAFKLNYTRARAKERLELDHQRLVVTRRDAWGRETRIELQPYWLRVELERDAGHPTQLLLSSHGKRHRIGSFLASDECDRLAAFLDDALRALREGRAMPAPPAHPKPSTSFIV